MTPTSLSPAKITPPRLGAYYPRRRLFERLDEGRARRVIWLSAPAGYGKTTLAASYLKERKIKALWYQCDIRDADPAAFFYYLREAARKLAPRKKLTLPLLTPEYLGGLPAFTRNFFEGLFEHIRKPVVLVLDNYQDVPESAPLCKLLPEALAVVPEGFQVMILSRTAPPATFAKLQANQNLDLIPPADLSLTSDETIGMAALLSKKDLPAQSLQDLYEKSHGWAAGLVLMLEQGRSTGPSGLNSVSATQEIVFAYFAEEVFSRLDPEHQEFLLITSLLPEPTVMQAQALSDQPGASSILKELSGRNYFTVQLEAGKDTYRFHPMFREFLLAKGKEHFDPKRWHALHHRAAELLLNEGQADEAGDLLMAIGDWQVLASLIRTHAQQQITLGRHATLHRWASALPAEALKADPWLDYWYAVGVSVINPNQARLSVKRALEGFLANEDLPGIALAWAQMVDLAYFIFNKFGWLENWLEKIQRFLDAEPHTMDAPTEARINGAMVGALLWHRPWRHVIKSWIERTESLMSQLDDPQLRMQAGHALALYHAWRGDLTAAQNAVNMVSPPAQPGRIVPLHHWVYQLIEAVFGWNLLEPARWRHDISCGISIAERTGLSIGKANLYAQGVYGSLSIGDQIQAQEYLEEMEACTNREAGLEFAHICYLKGWAALERGAPREATPLLQLGARLADDACTPFPHALNRFLLAQAMFETGTGSEKEVGAHLDVFEDIANKMESGLLWMACAYLRAYLAFETGDHAQGVTALRKALKLGQEWDLINYPGWQNRILAPLLAEALETKLEVPYVQRLIRKHCIVPGASFLHLENWPWPLKIYTLGRFSLVKDDQPLRFSTKAQKKPLEFLKVLIALGGREVSEALLAEALWPDAEGDMARQNIKATLYRLRQLIGAEALTVHEGKISLDARQCWVDVWSLERRMTSQLTQTGEQGNTSADGISHLLELYRGQFLTGEDAPWVLIPRERLRSRLLRTIEKVTDQLINDQHYERAIDCYQRALEIDPLAERIYQGLMRANIALNRIAEALTAHRRCKEILSAQLGIEPSPETEALAQPLRG